MSNFLDQLVKYIHVQFVDAVSQAEPGDLRLSFSGPPKSILSELFHRLLDGKKKLEFNYGSNTFESLVFLVDNQADGKIGAGMSCLCSSENLNSIRNQNIKQFIFLHEIGESISESLLTAKVDAGLKQKPESFEQWYSEPLIQHLTEEALKRFGIEHEPGSGISTAFKECLQETWEFDDSRKDKPHTWKLMQQIFDEPVADKTNYRYFLALLGMVNCDPNQVGDKEHCDVLETLGASFDSKSIQKSFEDLREIDKELWPLLDDFQNHISDCIMPADFNSAPILKYRPNLDSDNRFPDWWEKLTLDVWEQLLGDNIVSPSDILDVKPNNPLAVAQSGLPSIFKDHVHFKLDVKEGNPPQEITIYRASGNKKMDEVANLIVNPGESTYWSDQDIPQHDRFVKYKFESEGIKPISVKLISLENYSLGVVATSNNAKKAALFKAKKKGKELWYESDFQFESIGSHRLDLYKSSNVIFSKEIRCINNSSEQEITSSQKGDQDLRIITSYDDNLASCLIDADEECEFEFDVTINGAEHQFRINATSLDHTPTGASSEFERLVIEHFPKKGSTKVEVPSTRLSDLQGWILEEPENSFRPVGLGPDFKNAWHKPRWCEHDTLSVKEQILPPWPKADEFKVPVEFIRLREILLSFIKGDADNDLFDPIESIRLYDLMSQSDFRSALLEYLDTYLNWLNTDYHSAAWCDVVCLHTEEKGANSLESLPYAILLSPFHPIRLAWQCLAQELLNRNIKQKCPAASTLNPDVNPECILLPCQTPSGELISVSFTSVPSSSDYWAVLWSNDKVKDLNTDSFSHFFDDGLGVEVEGLTSGFTPQQVIRSLSEITKILAAQSHLSISIMSDTRGASNCNDGIEEWCSAYLGRENDVWFSSGGMSLKIVDFREEQLHPEQANLASLTALTEGAVTWFRRNLNDQAQARTDLAIIDHLGSAAPNFQKTKLRSAIDKTGLLRHRVRKQLSNEHSFLAESRVGKIPQDLDGSSAQGLLMKCVDAFESRCAENFDAFVFSPKLTRLHDGIKHSQFTAVTSSNIDAACFFGQQEEAFLWDYELPNYSARSGDNSGYYLLASESPSMIAAVQSAISTISPNESLDSDHISILLHEISRRGIPTLKRLTGGGAMTFGEVGVLAGFKMMQSDFGPNTSGIGLLCAYDEDDKTINLIIPVDSFQNHFDDLRSAIDPQAKQQRPDLLVFSILQVQGEAKAMRVTPIEVKARSDSNPMTSKNRADALAQASSFSSFLHKMKEESEESEIWGIAWRGLLNTMLDYGFRVYGQLDKFINNSEWEDLQASVLEQVASGTLEIQIDMDGRLILIDGSESNSRPKDQ
ncbi:MAG TPA: hypothetical protein DCY03_32380, partial [Planctomycetaceae bacterium]|nr:hypothetical protein [Planctomycetaceae bacterium]